MSDKRRGSKRKAATPISEADVVDLVATDEDAWCMTQSLARERTKETFAAVEMIWREEGTLPHLKNKIYGVPSPVPYSEGNRGWFNYCVESMYLPQVIDNMRRTEHGHKQLQEVDFATLYSRVRQEKQCKETLLMMAKTTPGEFWPVTPQSAFRLMAAAEHLQADLDNCDFASMHGHGFSGEAVDAWKAQGPVDIAGGRDPMRHRMFYFGLRDCFTKIAQRVASGKKPHPKTHAELWACCLLFEADDLIMGDGAMFDDVYGPQFDALPTHPWDEDFEITRYALLGPIYGAPARKRKPQNRGGAHSTPKPTSETRAQRAAAHLDAMTTGIQEDSKYALHPQSEEMRSRRAALTKNVCDLMAAGEELSDDDDGFGSCWSWTRESCVCNLEPMAISQWFEPLPEDFFKTRPSTHDAASQPPWDSQLSSSGWRNWPIVKEGQWGLVYVVSQKKFGYYDDDESSEECIVYFGQPLLGPQGIFSRDDLRKPPFDGNHVPL